MSDAFLWHMIGVDRFRMEGKARSIILYDKNVIIIDGTKPDYEIHLTAWDAADVARMVAIFETQAMEDQGLKVCNIYGRRNLGHGFDMKVAVAQSLYRTRQLEALETNVADIVFMIQQHGEKLDD